jgi:predicted enzyme related to lactoylglutathione lyase
MSNGSKTTTFNREGRFIWRELMAANIDAARRFYGELFGWTVKEWAGEKPYYLFHAGEKGVAGMMACPEGGQIPSRWTSYVSMSDVDACVERARAAGGKITLGPMDVPTVGRMAFIADPNGATTAVIKPQPQQADAPGGEKPAVGEFCWDSLQTPDPEGDVEFYRKVYGWSVGTFDGSITLGVGEGMMNQVASVGPTQGDHRKVGAGSELRSGGANWTTYVAVDALSAARDRVKRLGGSILMEAIPVPTMGTFAVVQDPDGAVLCLFEAERGA